MRKTSLRAPVHTPQWAVDVPRVEENEEGEEEGEEEEEEEEKEEKTTDWGEDEDS